MHDQLLSALQAIADVRLVAALKDPRLGFNDESDLRVFIPDLHLISESRRIEGGFRYATNHTALLTTVFESLRDLKIQAAQADQVVAVYVIGDFFDLWRETPGFDADDDPAARIRDDHEDLVVAVLDRALRTRFLLGNHDFALYRWADYRSWERRYYLPDKTLQAPSTIVLHGDIFDWVETLPDAVQQLFVYLFAPHLSPNAHDLEDMEKVVRRAHRNRKYRNGLQALKPLDTGTVRPLDGGPVPDRWNVQQPGDAPDELLKFLDDAHATTRQANEQFGLNLRAMVIGHTHHARIALKEGPGDEFFALIDCGAWIENSTWMENGVRVIMPSAHIAALSANEARIYQLAPLAG